MRHEPAGPHAKINIGWKSNAGSANVTILSLGATFNVMSSFYPMDKPLQYFYGLFQVAFGYSQTE